MSRIQLAEDTQALDEVVVVGYGTQAKKDITGSVAVVSTDAYARDSGSDILQKPCKERLPVCISRTRVDLVVRRRSVSVVSARLNGSDPLIVVDGVSECGYQMRSIRMISSLCKS